MDELLDEAPCGYMVLDADSLIRQINITLCEWLEYTREELTGQPLDRLLSVGGRIFYQSHITPLLRLQGHANEIYIALRTSGGRSIPVLTNAIRRGQGGSEVTTYAFLPMHQRREFEDELLEAKRQAVEAGEAKARFLSMMSHELRTPMNSILGFGQVLAMDDLGEAQNESVEHIIKAGRHLLGLINEVLDISRIDSGRLELAIEAVPAHSVVHDALEMTRPLAAAAGISVQSVPPQESWLVQADRGRLRQVLLNLTANAVKYNRPGGEVTVFCELPEDGEWLRFMVQDNGPGITPEAQDRLFQPFERLGAERTSIEGTGLGLALCKRLTEAMGGRIGVASSPGEGSTFWIDMPREMVMRPSVADAVTSRSPELAHARGVLLYVEDNAANLRVVEKVLVHRPNVKLLSALTGREGLQTAQAHRPDLILLDLHLPDIQGDEVLAQLLADDATRSIPVIMLSADATLRQIERLGRAGARDYITKPLDVKKFLRTLDAYMAE